jgi:PKD repeat protein
LTATNDFGYSSEQKDNYITVTTSDVPPVADFTFIPDPAIPAAAPIHIEFTDTST